MRLRNKTDDLCYIVTTEDDGYGGFMIKATPIATDLPGVSSFCMHYRSLVEFCEEWEDF